MIFDTEQLPPCVICREMVRGGNHVCSPDRVGRITFGQRESSFIALTEADVRRIVREELAAQRAGDR